MVRHLFQNTSSEFFLMLANADLSIGLLRPDIRSPAMKVQLPQRTTNTFSLFLASSKFDRKA